MAQQGVGGWSIFLFSKGAHFLLALGVPYWLLSEKMSFSILLAIYLYLLCQMFYSLLFVMLIVGTHWAKATFFQTIEQGGIPHSGYQHVFATTFDWHIRPHWVGYWQGGANLHLTHHLFPHWNHRHYRRISKLPVRQQTETPDGS